MERGGGRESVAELLRHRLIAKGGNEGCWSGCLVRSAAENQTARPASTAFLIDPGIGTAAGTGHHRPGTAIGTKKNSTCSVPFRNRWNKWNKLLILRCCLCDCSQILSLKEITIF